MIDQSHSRRRRAGDRRRVGLRPDARRRRQELHRAADHGRDDHAAAHRQGLQDRQARRARHRAAAPGAGSRPDRCLLGVYRHVADHLQQGDRQARCGGDLRQGEGARRRQGTGLAQSLEGEQHLCARHAQGRCRREGHQVAVGPRRQGEGRRGDEVRLQRRVLRAARRPGADAEQPTASSSAARTWCAWIPASSTRH